MIAGTTLVNVMADPTTSPDAYAVAVVVGFDGVTDTPEVRLRVFEPSVICTGSGLAMEAARSVSLVSSHITAVPVMVVSTSPSVYWVPLPNDVI